jgi:hypothetical protein|tara:strand:+ start:537 stop:851 length:315 start_codon:yes stop_codon:yes gene_type:complete
MNSFKRLKTAMLKVEYLLIKSPHLKDDDNKLVSTYHYYEIGPQNVLKMSAKELLQMYADGKLTQSTSICRVRAKLQEQKPGLRGQKYNNRLIDGEYTKVKINDL